MSVMPRQLPFLHAVSIIHYWLSLCILRPLREVLDILFLLLVQAMSLLVYLLDSVAPQDLVHLDPFPEGGLFSALSNKLEELRQEMVEATLTEEIDRFLAVGQQCPQAVRTEALTFLQKRLHGSKLELSSLVRQGNKGYYTYTVGTVYKKRASICKLCSCPSLPRIKQPGASTDSRSDLPWSGDHCRQLS